MAKKIKRIKEEILGIISVLGSIYLALSLYTYSKWDPSFLTYTKSYTQNYGGIIGSYASDLLVTFIGYISFSLPFFIFIYGIKKIIGRDVQKSHLTGAVLFLFFGSLMEALLMTTFNFTAENNPGGLIGKFISGLLTKYFSIVGAYIFSLSGFFSSLILLSPASIFSVSSKIKSKRPVIKPRPQEKAIIEEDIIIREPEPVRAKPVLIEPEPLPSLKMQSVPTPASKTGYELPSVEFLNEYDASSVRPSKEELLSNSALLESKLGEFDVEGRITHVQPGPVVTMYEFEPAAGIKINRVVTLADDLALALKAQSVRISPISGKSTIGIEIPNKYREVVSLREIISSDKFLKNQSKLTLALGKDISGEPVFTDLTKMPHLLVAGATGAGKSVSINSMVMSILYKASPGEVKMLMIDPKLLELSMYEDIPHLISKVITNPKDAADALRKMVMEMERRYRLLAEKGARNIESFNRQANEEDQIPYIIIFIDELADLMFASANEVEDSIARLAQMARAAGIHLILATQRPSVDVITGVIKANFPARISFQVFSKIDSRTILDSQGAEQLLGKGDMLLMLPGSKIMRVHGALITEDEIKAVTDFIKNQGAPDYTLLESIQVEDQSAEDISAERDDMFYKALEFAESVGEVSISSLQRRFKIGYNRAARIMEMMENDGLVGPSKGAGKPRDFLRRNF